MTVLRLKIKETDLIWYIFVVIASLSKTKLYAGNSLYGIYKKDKDNQQGRFYLYQKKKQYNTVVMHKSPSETNTFGDNKNEK